MLSLENTKSEDKESAMTEEENDEEEGNDDEEEDDDENVEDNEDGKTCRVYNLSSSCTWVHNWLKAGKVALANVFIFIIIF